MKLYRVVATDKSEFKVKADSYMALGGKYLFYINGKPIPDFFVTADSVLEISVESENVERDEKPSFWKRFSLAKSSI